MTDRLRCRFCRFSVKRFWKDRYGRLASGWPQLQRHAASEHMAEMKLVRAALAEVDERLEELERREREVKE